MRPLLQTLWFEIRSHLREFGSWSWHHRYPLLVALLLFGTMAIFTVPHDKDWVRDVKNAWPGGRSTAKALSFWGDYPFIGLIPGLGLFFIGLRKNRNVLARFGLALLLASSTAGFTTNMLRNSLGRPRPMAKLPDGLYGPSLKYQLHGSPSGHAGAAFGAATFVAVALPPLGIPAIGLAGGIAWSRVYLRAHHPTDVAFGAYFGVWAGIGFGLIYRRRKQMALGVAPSRLDQR